MKLAAINLPTHTCPSCSSTDEKDYDQNSNSWTCLNCGQEYEDADYGLDTTASTVKLKMSKTEWQSIGKQAGWFSKKKEAPVRTKEDVLIDHFKKRIEPKVKEELKRVANLDYHYVYLIKSIEKGLENMLSAYDKVNMRDKNMVERAKVEQILLEDPSSSLESLSQGLAPFLDEVNKTKDGDPIAYKISLKNYHDGLQRSYNLLHEFAENYFQALGRTDAIPKK